VLSFYFNWFALIYSHFLPFIVDLGNFFIPGNLH